MEVSVFLEIAALVNSVVILYAYIIHKKLPDAKTSMFLFLTITLLVVIIANLTNAYLFANASLFPIWLLTFVNSIYVLSAVILAFAFCLFSLSFTHIYMDIKKLPFIVFIIVPLIVQIVIILLIPIYNIVFTIDENKVYSRDFGCLILQVIAFLHVTYGFISVLFSNTAISSQNKWFYYSYLFVAVAGLAVQIFVRDVLLQDYAISLSILLLFYSLQEKDVIVAGTTGLLNQKAFNVYASNLFRKKAEFCVVNIHIDDLPFLTTTFGIEGINSILNKVAVYLKEIAADSEIFHLSNDTFCVMFPTIDAKTYSAFTSDCLDRFNEPWKGDILEIKLNARLCVIRCPEDAETTEGIFETIHTVADDPRYKEGKLLFADKIDVNTKKRYAFVEQLVRTAIQERRIEVYYQPLYSISEQRIIGAEALVRMKDHDGNFISPEEFVPIAEQNGQILRIGLYVYEEVCRFVSSCHLHELGIRMIDVNLSVAQCMQTRLCDDFQMILKSYSLDPTMINLEITETAAAHNMELLYSTMEKLNAIGFSCSLDDYGMGYANINYILHMAFSMIKIDKGIIWGAMKNVHAYIILVGIINMIHQLDMKIVAEGIETQEMVDKLTELNCDYLQGYYYSRPIPEAEFLELVKNQAKEKGIIEDHIDEVFPETLYPADAFKAESLDEDVDIEELEEIEDIEEVEEVVEDISEQETNS